MLNIGLVDIDTSHPLAFAQILKQSNKARYAAVFNDGVRGSDEVYAFARVFSPMQVCKSMEELASISDVGFIQSCNWEKHVEAAEHFIKRKKPVFIDKPIVGNVSDLKRLNELAESGAVIFGGSSMRYAWEIQDFLSMPAAQRGEIIHVTGTCGVDEFNYGIHIVEAIGALLWGAASCKHVGGNDKSDMYHIQFVNGSTADYLIVRDIWLPCALLITTTRGVFHFTIDSTQVYKALLDRLIESLTTGKNTMAGIDRLSESITIMLAGQESKCRSGKTIPLYDTQGRYDGFAFERQYRKNVKKIYLEIGEN